MFLRALLQEWILRLRRKCRVEMSKNLKAKTVNDQDAIGGATTCMRSNFLDLAYQGLTLR